MTPPLKQTWRVLNHGPQEPDAAMAFDRAALDNPVPTLRFFQWNKSVVSFGYLMDETAVKAWAPGYEIVRRPTGGGAVLHKKTDLSLSIIWPRGQAPFPEKPADCYKAIHALLINALGDNTLTLHAATTGNCAPRVDLSICFEQPVCNDVMRGGKKVIGGALRLTRNAILYQGNILLESGTRLKELAQRIERAFS